MAVATVTAAAPRQVQPRPDAAPMTARAAGPGGHPLHARRGCPAARRARRSSTSSSSRSSRSSTAWASASSTGARRPAPSRSSAWRTTRSLLARPGLLAGGRQHRDPRRPGRRRIQVVLGTALALFFDLHLRGMWFVRGVLILPMLLTPDRGRPDVARAAQPRLGDGQLASWASWGCRSRSGWPTRRSRSSRWSSWTRGSGRRSSWSSCSRASRRCPGTCSRRPRWTARRGARRCWHVTLPLLAPAIVVRRRSSGPSTRSARSTSCSA